MGQCEFYSKIESQLKHQHVIPLKVLSIHFKFKHSTMQKHSKKNKLNKKTGIKLCQRLIKLNRAVNNINNHKVVCQTSPATPGLVYTGVVFDAPCVCC